MVTARDRALGCRVAKEWEAERSTGASRLSRGKVKFKEGEMIDEIVERAFPWGVFLGFGALIGAAFPRETRTAAKTAMMTGFRAADWLRGVSAEAYEKGQDVFAEARVEYAQMVREAQRDAERGRLRVVSAQRRRASGSRSNGQGTRKRRTTGTEHSASESR